MDSKAFKKELKALLEKYDASITYCPLHVTGDEMGIGINGEIEKIVYGNVLEASDL